MKVFLKILCWTLLAAVLCAAGLLIGTVKLLTPERLTPMVEQVANRTLNADVSVRRVELSLRKSFPFLSLDVDSVTLLSRDILSLPPAARDTLPEWGDTLLSVDHMHGGINVFKALRRIIDLKDLEITGPKVNVLVVNDSLNNFSVAPPSEPSESASSPMPDIRLNRFALVDPRPIRYADLAQDMRVEARITSATLTNSTDNPGAPDYVPLYHVDFDSDVASPWLRIIGQESCPVGFSGIVEWDHLTPYQITLSHFGFAVSSLSGEINTCVDFEDALTVKDFDFTFRPLSVSGLLQMVPDSTAREYGIPKELVTDATMSFEGRLIKEYTVGTTDLPVARLQVSIPPCQLQYGRIGLRNIELEATANTDGGSLNDAVVAIDRLVLEGPATQLEIKGSVTRLLDDPLFDGEIDGHTDISLLPDILTRRIGARLEGTVSLNTSVIASPSMFSRQYFHRLRLAGDVKVDNFLYLADDTLTMYALRHTLLHFGTHERFASSRGVLSDSLLSAKLTVDTANLLVSGLDMKVGRLSLGVGAQNRKASADTTLVIPMGGALRVGTFSLFSITDSAGLRVRGISGHASMQRYLNDAHLPLFSLRLGLANLSTGNNHTRFMASDARLNCSFAKLPIEKLSQRRQQVRHIADSLHRRHPQLSIDSVYVLAAEIRRRGSGKGHHRVHTEMSAQDQEIIDWGTSSAMQRLLLDWEVTGGLSAGTARLFSSAFPVRNRVEGLNIAFCNDSISLTDVKYKAGDSDFLISGNITNLRRALTSRRQPNALKVNFSLISDYIDVNQLAHALFAGSARKGESIGDELTDMDTLEGRTTVETDTVAPLLIPTNIDAELKVKARGVAYSDFVLHDFSGTVLLYDGAINLHDLRASSQVGSIDLTALYSAPSANDIDFGFGMKLDNFNIHNFLRLVPAVDTIMPMLRDLSGIINANLALTSKINSSMDLVLPSVKAAINISGDSLSLIDPATFRKVAKWLMFKDKERNLIDHVSAEMIVEDGQMRVYPFIFDFDRYRLGIQGYNDFDMNFNYHVAVLKSPVPFRFGINLKGDYDKLKIRLGRAKFNERTSQDRTAIVNDTRINLINQFQNVFRRGVRNSKFASIDISDKPLAQEIDLEADTLTAEDSLYFRQQGLIPE